MESAPCPSWIATWDERDHAIGNGHTRMTEFSERRRRYMTDPLCEMVSPREFMTMMLSHHEFTREDDPSLNLLGLKDPLTGGRVFVRAEDLERERHMFLQIH